MPQTPFTLPAGFLSKPAREIHVERIDFTKTPLPLYRDLYAVILDNALTKVECDDLV